MARITLTALTVALLITSAARATSNDTEASIRDANGHTALMIAAAHGDTAQVRQLIDQGADVNATGRIGNTALIYAAQEGHGEVARLLIEAGANIAAANDYGTTAHELAVGYGHREIAERLAPAPERQEVLFAGFF